ncbi:hypothetical protein KVV02_007762 [Mortierella alpina]|uniref:Tropomyosin n=1 Tax=Mortierella alpina TaxID=64518 RepID=A0A9P8CXU9_MORAP|nr:hypothetical protein KVV02_007762 [Mortierella alpina]
MDKFKEKIANLRSEADDALAKAEETEKELQAIKAEVSSKDQDAISLNNRIALLESQLEKAESGGSESQKKLRELELKAEDLERKVKTLEKENETLETKLEDTTAEHQKIKDELDETLKAMDEM